MQGTMEAQYNATATKVEEEVLAMSRSNLWVKMKTQNQVDIYSAPSSHFNGSMYKYVCTVDAPCSAVYDVLKPPITTEERMRWDKSIADYRRLITFNDNLFIAVIISPAVLMGVISAREFLDLFLFKTIETAFSKECWVFATSVKYSERPETDRYVRAHTHPSGYVAKPLESDPSKTCVEFYINIETGVMLPRSLVESAMPSQQIKYIENLKNEVKRRIKS